MRALLKRSFYILFSMNLIGCAAAKEHPFIQTVTGPETPIPNQIWLSHEHILVDFIGADSIRPDRWDRDLVQNEMMPFIDELKSYQVKYFVDATPNYLGRDVVLLQRIARQSGLKVITNTGLYGARENKYVPSYAYQKTSEELAQMWVSEYQEGIDGTSIKPGFIKISVDASDPLDPMHQKLVEAAALTHLKTGLTIASHTGSAKGLWPQLKILKEKGVAPESFIWVHAQNEDDLTNYLRAAEMGCWISLDGLGWEVEQHVEKLLFAKEHGILERFLISHDAGWYDPQKKKQSVKPYTNIFKELYAALIGKGFTAEEFQLLVSKNPSAAFSITIRKQSD